MKRPNENPDLTTALLDQDSNQDRVVTIDPSESKSILRAAEVVQESLQHEASLYKDKIDRTKLFAKIASRRRKKFQRSSATDYILLLLVVVTLAMVFKREIMTVVEHKLAALSTDISGFTNTGE